MLKSLFLFLQGLVGGALANILIGAGLGVVSFSAISAAIYSALALMQSYVGGITTDALQVVLMLGFGEALSIIGSALLVRAAIASAGVGIGKAASASS